VAIALCLLALLNALAYSTFERSARRLIGNGLALTASVVCLACLILPRISPYKVLLSPSAFSLVAAGLFSPVLLYLPHAARTLIGAVIRGVARVTRVWRRHEVTFERGAALLGLAAIAIAQPLFEVVTNSPEFFPARSTPPRPLSRRCSPSVSAFLSGCSRSNARFESPAGAQPRHVTAWWWRFWWQPS